MESKLTCGSILKPLPTVAGGNLPTFGSWFPKKVESDQVAQLMTTNPEDLGNVYKNAHWRELMQLIPKKWSFRWMYFREIQRKGIVEEFEGITAEWSSAAFKLKDITAECRVFYWVIGTVYYLHTPPVLSQEYQEQAQGSWGIVVWALSRSLVGRNDLLTLLSSILIRFYIILL